MAYRSFSQTRGFTLIEILVSVGIVGVMAVIFHSAISESAVLRQAKGQELALRIATNKLEDLRALGYASLPSSGTFSDSQLSSLPQSSATLTVTVENASTKRVVITVTWSEAGISAPQTVTLASFITSVGGL